MTPKLRSLKHEYELYVEQEVEHYKESVSRGVLLSIGDEAVASLAEEQQLALTELLLCDEVDRIIKQRLRVPNFQAWKRRRLRALQEFSRPERWGIDPHGPLVREVPAESHVLVAGALEDGAALYLAANGCAVTALDAEPDVVERVVTTAVEVGLTSRLRGLVSDLRSWSPDFPLNAFVCTPAAFAGLSAAEREQVIALLQQATTDGGVHLVETIVAGRRQLSIEELTTRYRGWQITVEHDVAAREMFLARKAVA